MFPATTTPSVGRSDIFFIFSLFRLKGKLIEGKITLSSNQSDRDRDRGRDRDRDRDRDRESDYANTVLTRLYKSYYCSRGFLNKTNFVIILMFSDESLICL